MTESPFTPADKINMIEGFATMPISVLIGLSVGWIGNLLAWPIVLSLSVTAAVVIVFLCTPLPKMVRGFARRKAESHYYGT